MCIDSDALSGLRRRSRCLPAPGQPLSVPTVSDPVDCGRVWIGCTNAHGGGWKSNTQSACWENFRRGEPNNGANACAIMDDGVDQPGRVRAPTLTPMYLQRFLSTRVNLSPVGIPGTTLGINLHPRTNLAHLLL